MAGCHRGGKAGGYPDLLSLLEGHSSYWLLCRGREGHEERSGRPVRRLRGGERELVASGLQWRQRAWRGTSRAEGILGPSGPSLSAKKTWRRLGQILSASHPGALRGHRRTYDCSSHSSPDPLQLPSMPDCLFAKKKPLG